MSHRQHSRCSRVDHRQNAKPTLQRGPHAVLQIRVTSVAKDRASGQDMRQQGCALFNRAIVSPNFADNANGQ